MRVAIISDIHGNIEALYSVLKDIKKLTVDRIFCTGDLVNYGSNPVEVIDLCIRENISSTLGNHDQATFDMYSLIKLNQSANESILMTLDALKNKHIEYLKSLPISITFRNLHFVHALPPENIHTYITRKSNDAIKDLFFRFDSKICFIGHTHLLNYYVIDNKELKNGAIEMGRIKLNPEKRYIINVGSVGQPRDGIPKAKYVIFDEKDWSLEARFVELRDSEENQE